jgi:hypothetical protein
MRSTARLLSPLLLLLLLPAAHSPAAAQEGDTLRNRFLIPLAPTFDVPARGRLIAPAISLGVPTGYGAGSGNAFLGVGFQSRGRDTDQMDGAIFGGFGLGSSRQAVGLEVTVLSYGTVDSCCRGGVTAKLHRLLPFNSAVAVGAENLLLWRVGVEGPASDVPRSFFGVASKVFRLRDQVAEPFSALTISAGVGTGRFGTVEDIMADRDRLRPFGTSSLRVLEPISVLGEWTARDLSAGMSITPLRNRSLIITPAVVDLRTDPRFVVSAGYGFGYTLPF